MAQIKIVSGSYQLRVRKADVQRSVNLFPSIVESGTGKAPAILQSIPGLVLFADLGAPIRGMFSAKGRLYAVAGSGLKELSSAAAITARGTLLTSTGPVGMDQNLNQLIITDGANGYVSPFATNVFAQIGGAGWLGSVRVTVLDGMAIFVKPDSQMFYVSAVDDATVLDVLDFASAEGSPDNIVTQIADHGQAFFFGASSVEIWDNTGGTDFALTRNNGARIETGCAAAFTVRKLDNTVYWLGQDERGAGIVWKFNGYTPVRVSTQAIEEVLQGAADLSTATAYTYQQDGHSFYCLSVPGLPTTWCYDVASENWHERAELVNGEYEQHRGHFHAFAFGKHLIGGDDGKIYEYDPEANTNAGDVLVRDRISPHMALPSYAKIQYASLQVDCVVGKGKPDGSAPSLMMRYSNEGGEQWGNWRTTTMGAIGERSTRAMYRRLGGARDRVWQIRCTDDTPFAIVGANVE